MDEVMERLAEELAAEAAERREQDLQERVLKEVAALPAPVDHVTDGAREGAPFIRDHIIRRTEHAFDDFAASGADADAIRQLLGLGANR